MTTNKRRTQWREAQRRRRAKKSKEGYIYFGCQIKPEWRKMINAFINKLKEI
jgi:hypothetical protein